MVPHRIVKKLRQLNIPTQSHGPLQNIRDL